MAEPARKSETPLYEQDLAVWADDQGRMLRDRRAEGLDWDNLAEEIESLSRRDKSEIRSRLIALVMHLLKWEFQPEKRSHSWQSTIGEQRVHVEGILEYSPSLERFPSEIFEQCYAVARREAEKETKLQLKTFPDKAPFSVEEALDYGFMPGRPWSPDDLA
jgi:hypothetical protein